MVAAALGIAGSAWLAKSIAAPIGQLVGATQKVAAGNFDGGLDVPRVDEIGQLARAFNQMTAGLRERADMTKFVSASTMEMIQRRPEPGAQAGERKVITVLFADIRGFTACAEQRAPEEAVAVLNRYLSLQADLVKRFHGDVDKFMGDAVFAHFTGPDMVLDAIRCGLEIQRALNGLSGDEAGLSVGVGIATGEVLVGSIGSADRLDYTAIGPSGEPGLAAVRARPRARDPDERKRLRTGPRPRRRRSGRAARRERLQRADQRVENDSPIVRLRLRRSGPGRPLRSSRTRVRCATRVSF